MQLIGRTVRNAGLAALLAVLMAGCSSIKDHRGYLVDQPLLDSIQPGIDNQLSVERALGRPTFVSQFGQPSWYYVSINTQQAAFTRPRTSEQLVLRVRFDPKGNVLAVDRAGIEKVAQIDPNGDKTPTLGRERSFFEDLFGNIGTVGAPGVGGGSTGPGPGGGPNGS
ncbi:MAG TPA: outer membrane protein assembly factor BamE [Novosphingobium sp.]|nr:outer membrane protein assembly factor BamE [Novosphingobium sp.]